MIVSEICHAMMAIVGGWFVLASYRWSRRRSNVIGALVAITILLRAVLGVALFWISYLNLPIAKSLQLGGGFWQPAVDATGYFRMAAHAADAVTLYPLDHMVPSPFFVDILALWMMAVGVSPASALFLNLCLYLALVRLIVWSYGPCNDWRRNLPCIVGVAAYSFSPVVLIHSTQPLKDELSSVLIAVACLSILGVRRLIYIAPNGSPNRDIALGTLALSVATLGTAGIRWYFAAIIWCALASLFALYTVVGRSAPLRRYLAGSTVVLLAASIGFWGGAGPFASTFFAFGGRTMPSGGKPTPAGPIRQLAELPLHLVKEVAQHRIGFLMSGGNTNIIVPVRASMPPDEGHAVQVRRAPELGAPRQAAAAQAKSPSGTAPDVAPPTAVPAPSSGYANEADAARSIPQTVPQHAGAISAGLAIVFVPLSVLKVFGIETAGGRGLLSITDLDTVFQDTTMLLVFVLLWRQRRIVDDRLPFVIFGLVLSAATAVLLGYVVTNFGTLWRLRPMLAVPLWVLVVALAPRRDPRGQSSACHEPVRAGEIPSAPAT